MDLLNTMITKQSLSPRLITAAVDGVGVDRAGHSRALFHLDTGTIGGSATPTVTMKMQDSTDNSAFADVPAADLIGGGQTGAIGAAEDDAVYRREYMGSKRYLRWSCSAVSGTSPSLPAASAIILGQSLKQPSA